MNHRVRALSSARCGVIGVKRFMHAPNKSLSYGHVCGASAWDSQQKRTHLVLEYMFNRWCCKLLPRRGYVTCLLAISYLQKRLENIVGVLTLPMAREITILKVCLTLRTVHGDTRTSAPMSPANCESPTSLPGAGIRVCPTYSPTSVHSRGGQQETIEERHS